MPAPAQLSRRERQIMDVIFARGGATVREIQEAIADAPSEMAVRRLLHILEEKGHLRRRMRGRAVVYSPRQAKAKAGLNALRHVLNTFFGGAVDEALAAHLADREVVTNEQLERMRDLIARTRKEGR
ncbi:MAG: BlaI/MecI/CopY family transcriptional regulator [Planctomycetaceae bacterium]